ncbi:MAG: helix-turn-helix domain-containing protein [Desulfovibrio sp.]|nr:helix-turn-helix domain-containing protein [Desulfovibrio sp.]
MRTAVKIRLLPTPAQEKLFWKSAGTARWAYNYYLNAKKEAYQEWVSNGKQGKIRSVSANKIRTEITKLKHTTHPWLNEVGSNVPKQAVKDADDAYQRFY